MLANNPNRERPLNYIRFDVYKAGVAIVATIARIRKEVTILWQSTVRALSEAQAVEYAGALQKAIRWASANSGHPTGWENKPGNQVATDNLTFSKRFLFHDDDSLFVEVSRKPLGFGLWSKLSVTIDGASGNMERANQAMNSINAALEDARKWGK